MRKIYYPDDLFVVVSDKCLFLRQSRYLDVLWNAVYHSLMVIGLLGLGTDGFTKSISWTMATFIAVWAFVAVLTVLAGLFGLQSRIDGKARIITLHPCRGHAHSLSAPGLAITNKDVVTLVRVAWRQIRGT